MLTFSSGDFYRVTSELRDLRHCIVAGTEFSNPDVMEESSRHVFLCEIVLSQLKRLKEQLSIIGCQVTINAIEEHSQLLTGGALHTREGLIFALDDIDAQLKREASSINLFTLNYGEMILFYPSTPLFGAEVASKFQSVDYEIADAGKCLALERSTASAFHSIRAQEAGIKALARCLQIPDPTKGADRSWGKVLKSIKDEIDKQWPPHLIRTSDAKIFEQAYAALAAINPYRNDTMHLDQKYTAEEARDIFSVVGAFMRKLVSRLSIGDQ